MKKSISSNEINKNYRQYSFSESDKDNSNKLGSYKIVNISNLSILPVSSDENNESKTEETLPNISTDYMSLDENLTNPIKVNYSINQKINVTTKQKKCWFTYLLKKILLFIFHLLLISIFEIVFFLM